MSKAKDANQAKRSVADRLAELALTERYSIGRSLDGRPFVIEDGGRNVVHYLRGSADSFRASLSALYYRQEERVPPSTALADTVRMIEGMALEAPARPVALRYARRDDGAIVIDLGDDLFTTAIVEPGGGFYFETSQDRKGRLLHDVVLFERTQLTRPMVLSSAEDYEGLAGLDRLRSVLNVTDQSWPLLVAWMVAAMIPDVPRPLLLLRGEQGTGKTTAAKMLSGIIDPSAAPVQGPPKSLDTWIIAASGSSVVTIDNLSHISTWLSDALCRASTGESMVKRRLYSDSDLVTIGFRRSIMLTTIDPGALSGDLADRLVAIDLERITGTNRLRERDLWDRYDAIRPTVFGALLRLLSQVLELLPDITVEDSPRMADFAAVLAAVDQVLGTSALDTFRNLNASVSEDVIESDAVAMALLRIVDRAGGTWEGTAQDLLDALHADPAERPRGGWPTTAGQMGNRLRRIAPALSRIGIEIDRWRSGRNRTRMIRLRSSDTRTLADEKAPNDAANDRAPDDTNVLTFMGRRHQPPTDGPSIDELFPDDNATEECFR